MLVRTWILALLTAAVPPVSAERLTIPLDGVWDVEDSVEASAMPAAFGHRVDVPGLTNMARPAFPDVDRFDSAAVISNRIRQGKAPESAMPDGAGVPLQKRNYFWYRTSFQPPERRSAAVLKINKAQFGTAVWVNGKPVGEHPGCFTAGHFTITEAVRWDAANTVTVRIGAHPGVLPREIPAGDDFEKNLWTPGIYDSVSVLLMDNPVIETLQVAPRIQTSEILVQTRLRNHGAEGGFTISHVVRTWKEGEPVATAAPRAVHLEAGAVKTITQFITIPNRRLWSPEDPFLYAIDTRTDGDSVTTRFGMREFRFDTATKRAYLNGKVYFARGSNITLHRFFEDPRCGNLPWDEAWVRRLLVDIPKRMNWNMFRFCIGPVPDRWLEIADEAGLLIQNEYPIWTGHPSWNGLYDRTWKADVLIREYSEWMRDNWNHPSVVIWDANNESFDGVFAEKVIPEVRGLDLSGRPWENSYNLPAGPDDPVEDHPYLFSRNQDRNSGPEDDFTMAALERMSSRPGVASTPSGHAVILNEYGWLWLNRDGTPTELTGTVYEKLLGPDAAPEARFRLNGYYLGGLTEFWRAHRNYAGVLHFVYLTSSDPEAYTADHFRDIGTLELEPNFEDYVGEAFKPVGVYINFWQDNLKSGAGRDFIVMLVNDPPRRVQGRLLLELVSAAGKPLLREEAPLDLAPLGQRTYRFHATLPEYEGEAELRAKAIQSTGETTTSRRKTHLSR